MMFILMMTMITSMMIIFMTHPLSMGMTMLIQVFLIFLITGLLSFNYWFSYILFIIMIGGMLVLFIYMTSIASNEKFNYSFKLSILLSLMFFTATMMIFLIDNMMIEYKNFNFDNIQNYAFNLTLSKFLNSPYKTILFILIIYLFITLIAVVKISGLSNGPLRQMN